MNKDLTWLAGCVEIAWWYDERKPDQRWNETLKDHLAVAYKQSRGGEAYPTLRREAENLEQQLRQEHRRLSRKIESLSRDPYRVEPSALLVRVHRQDPIELDLATELVAFANATKLQDHLSDDRPDLDDCDILRFKQWNDLARALDAYVPRILKYLALTTVLASDWEPQETWRPIDPGMYRFRRRRVVWMGRSEFLAWIAYTIKGPCTLPEDAVPDRRDWMKKFVVLECDFGWDTVHKNMNRHKAELDITKIREDTANDIRSQIEDYIRVHG